jgi:hypothetical protein
VLAKKLSANPSADLLTCVRNINKACKE